ncbi:unnamed protein product [Spirodela intermedia]|uniref:Uncharacterized protein n=1 Tax=Spirodela intermedia TaxID=51605 RepID=A0A7I8IDC2_SPIIN|nr:unnamed protein product [Spirodela intermedia]CAA6655766.1 unnamed protein product [Spirodela intermedia]
MFGTVNDSTNAYYLEFFCVLPARCPRKAADSGSLRGFLPDCQIARVRSGFLYHNGRRIGLRCHASVRSPDNGNGKPMHNPVRLSVKSQNLVAGKRLSGKLSYEDLSQEPLQVASNFTNFQEDPMVDKLRTQLGVIHPIPSPPINRNIVGLFVFFFFFGAVVDKLGPGGSEVNQRGKASQKDLQRKESVEWVNMVLGKLWKVYQGGIENWIIGLLQPVIDDLKKPEYVQRVEIKQFSLGDDPLSVRNVERRTSRRANDLQYQIGLRYTGGARMLLSLSLKFGIIPIVVPVGVRDFDIDGELWVKLRLIQSEPWVGAIKFELSPFRLFNLMAIPVLSMFLTKLLTEDLPRLFVRPKKIVLDFQKGKALGPVAGDSRGDTVQEGNKDFVGELSVTLVDARRVPYVFFAKTDPFVVLSLGDQLILSKRNSQTTVIGPPGDPIWNQDFHLLVSNPKKQKLCIQVKDSFGFGDFTVGSGEVELGSLQDTVPTDRVIDLQGRWGPFGISSGEILLRLTYKRYVEDEEDDPARVEYVDTDASDDETDSDESIGSYKQSRRAYAVGRERESFMDVLAALIVSEEFQGIVASEPGSSRNAEESVDSEPSASRPADQSSGIPQLESQNLSGGPAGNALFWYAVITCISFLVSTNVSGSSVFNP